MNTTSEAVQNNIEQIETPLDVARRAFSHWNDILQTGDAAAVAELYTEDASFLPTLATRNDGREKTEEYFVHFLEKRPFGSITEDTVQQLSGDTIIHSGLYDFEVGPENDRSVVHARFTFVWSRTEDGWKILHHHSSADPA